MLQVIYKIKHRLQTRANNCRWARRNKKGLLLRLPQSMELLPLHRYPEFKEDSVDVLNEEWPRSKSARWDIQSCLQSDHLVGVHVIWLDLLMSICNLKSGAFSGNWNMKFPTPDYRCGLTWDQLDLNRSEKVHDRKHSVCQFRWCAAMSPLIIDQYKMNRKHVPLGDPCPCLSDKKDKTSSSAKRLYCTALLVLFPHPTQVLGVRVSIRLRARGNHLLWGI